MAVSTQDILNGIINMQANAQAALPVIPNNGNPGGAYNMPARPSGPAPAVPDGTTTVGTQRPVTPVLDARYPWLQPSQSAVNVRALLQRRRTQPQSPPIIPPAPQEMVVQRQLPVIPIRR